MRAGLVSAQSDIDIRLSINIVDIRLLNINNQIFIYFWLILNLAFLTIFFSVFYLFKTVLDFHYEEKDPEFVIAVDLHIL